MFSYPILPQSTIQMSGVLGYFQQKYGDPKEESKENTTDKTLTKVNDSFHGLISRLHTKHITQLHVVYKKPILNVKTHIELENGENRS